MISNRGGLSQASISGSRDAALEVNRVINLALLSDYLRIPASNSVN